MILLCIIVGIPKINCRGCVWIRNKNDIRPKYNFELTFPLFILSESAGIEKEAMIDAQL